MIPFTLYSLLLTLNSLSISPSAYFTYGDLSDGAKSYSVATYWTLEYKRNHFLFAYDNYTEEDPLWNIKQNLFSLGYTREILSLLGVRGVGWYMFDSDNNIARILSARLLYGYNPVFTVGYAISSYSRQWWSGREFYIVYQITPECRIFVFKRGWWTTRVHYINAEGEKYLSLSSSLSLNIVPKFSIGVDGMFGERFYFVDDKLLVVNNRPNVEKGIAGVKISCGLTKNISLVLDLKKDFFRTYNINYYVLGLQMEF